MFRLRIIVTLSAYLICVCLAAEWDCCPPGYVILEEYPFDCLDNVKNITVPNPVVCSSALTEKALLTGKNNANFTLDDERKLIVSMSDFQFSLDNFCLGNTSQYRAVVTCTDEPEEYIDNNFTGYLILVSAFFLLLTAAIYASSPELTDLQGKSIICLCTSLAIGLILFAYLKLEEVSELSPLCAVRGFVAYFFLVGAFIWMGAISLQILLGLRRPLISNYGWRDFLVYFIFVWGLTSTILLIVVILNYHSGEHLKPGIGLVTCWFTDKKHVWVYLYSVMSVVMLFNTSIFIYASICLWRHSFSSGNLKAMRYRFWLMLRLFIVMGLPWILEMVDSTFDGHIIQYIFDAFIALQGLCIFIIMVVLRRRAVKVLRRRGWLSCCGGCVDRYLAKADDDEDQIVEHTAVVPMEEQ